MGEAWGEDGEAVGSGGESGEGCVGGVCCGGKWWARGADWAASGLVGSPMGKPREELGNTDHFGESSAVSVRAGMAIVGLWVTLSSDQVFLIEHIHNFQALDWGTR